MSFKPQNATVWAEIPVGDLSNAIEFYRTVFQFDLTRNDTGPNPVAMIGTDDGMGVAGHLYPGTPASDGRGPTIHLCVPDTVEDAMRRLVKAGGHEVSPVVTIPPGRFAYATDPDGNSLGLFEPGKAG